ncbi:hypothetical protein DFAR_440012 [Desulfarculales bacterium]
MRQPREGGVSIDQQREGGEPAFLRALIIQAGDFAGADNVSIAVKNLLKELGFPPEVLCRATIAALEAEMNVVTYGDDGQMEVHLAPRVVRLVISDQWPGIPDLDWTWLCRRSWSTATPKRFARKGLRHQHGPAQHRTDERHCPGGSHFRFTISTTARATARTCQPC